MHVRREKGQPAIKVEDTAGRFNRFGSSELVQGVIAKLDDLIEQGALVPGQRLIESDLVRDLNVGRMPVREAIRILAGDGVVELLPNRGARIRKYDRKEMVEILQVITGATLVAVRLFCRNSPNPEAGNLRAALERIKLARSFNSPLEMIKSQIYWRSVVERGSGNTYLMETMRRYQTAHYGRHLSSITSVDALKDTADLHEKMTAFILEGDYQAAGEIISHAAALTEAAILQG